MESLRMTLLPRGEYRNRIEVNKSVGGLVPPLRWCAWNLSLQDCQNAKRNEKI